MSNSGWTEVRIAGRRVCGWLLLSLLLSACSWKAGLELERQGVRLLEGNEWQPLFQQQEQLFRAVIDFRAQHFSGLMAVKKTEMGFRFAFFTELGMTMFDLEVGPDSFVQHYCFEPLNRKALLRILEADFRRLSARPQGLRAVLYRQASGHYWYRLKLAGDRNVWGVSASGRQLLHILHPSLLPDEAEINISYRDQLPERIEIVHPKLGLRIGLSRMQVTGHRMQVTGDR
ncbi:MAG: hypothetical protein D6730_18520 [Bacteroidetes bacterium]|nr:MAG: hypothetical protein D6730_18520 [Bacteroidota bacterium]